MPRYYFHLHDHVERRDEEGAVLPDAEAAMAYALYNARSMMAENVRQGEVCLSHNIEVQDELGETIGTMPFRNAVKIVP